MLILSYCGFESHLSQLEMVLGCIGFVMSASNIGYLCTYCLMPEVSLPNFFMPPRELEQTMRSLRASALSRPPPRTLFGDHNPPQTQPMDSCEAHLALLLQQSSQVRTLQDVNEFLKSRRAGRDVQIEAGHYQEISTKHAQRLSRIFTSKPLPSYSEHK